MQDLDKEIDLKKYLAEDVIRSYGICANIGEMDLTKEQILEKLKRIDARNKRYLEETLQNNVPKLKTDEELKQYYQEYLDSLDTNIKTYTQIVHNLDKSIRTLKEALKNVPTEILTYKIMTDALTKLTKRKQSTQSSLDGLIQVKKSIQTFEQYKQDKLDYYQKELEHYERLKVDIGGQLKNFHSLADEYETFLQDVDTYLK